MACSCHPSAFNEKVDKFNDQIDSILCKENKVKAIKQERMYKVERFLKQDGVHLDNCGMSIHAHNINKVSQNNLKSPVVFFR